MEQFIRVFLLVLIGAAQAIDGKVFTVATTCQSDTANKNCLAHYLQDPASYLFNGVVFLFEPGVHSLSDEAPFTVRDLENVFLLGPPHSAATIQCSGSTGLTFLNVSDLVIENVTVDGCGMEMTRSFLQQSMHNLTSTLLGSSTAIHAGIFMSLIRNLTLSNVIVQHSKGYGMIALNLIGETKITSVTFNGNNFQSLDDSQCLEHLLQECKGGNLLLIFSDFQSNCSEIMPNYVLDVYNSTFKLGIDLGPVYPLLSHNGSDTTGYLGGAGVGIAMTQTTYGIQVILRESTLTENAAYVGSNLYVTIFDQVINSGVLIRQSKLEHGNNILSAHDKLSAALAVAQRYTMAPGFFLAHDLLADINFYQAMCTTRQQNLTEIFRLQSCEIAHNKATLTSAGHVYMWIRSKVDQLLKLVINNSSIHDNRGSIALSVSEFSNPKALLPFQLLLKNSKFFRNNDHEVEGEVEFSQSMIGLSSLRYCLVHNCSFFGNTGSSIQAINSAIFMRETNQFIGNVAPSGAGLNLQEGSTMNLEPHSVTIFKDNHAFHYGGAINAVSNSFKCFYQVLANSPQEYPKLVFENNTAEGAGNAIYGAVNVCFQIKHNIQFTKTDALFSQISSNLTTNTSSPVTYVAYRVCFCQDTGSMTMTTDEVSSNLSPDCENNTANEVIFAYPGQTIMISVAGQGYSGHLGIGFSPATVHSSFNTSTVSIGRNQYAQQLRNGCSNLTYNFYSAPQPIKMSLVPDNDKFFITTYINVTILDCPAGFQTSQSEKTSCICQTLLDKRGLTCDIDTQMITRNRRQWIGYDNATRAVVIGRCPSTYCNRNQMRVSLDNTDEQCSPNRSGILCGTCRQGSSIVLGSSNRCMECSSYTLFLLILFAALGVLLILFLSVTNVTTATGMINALLYYANIVKFVELPNIAQNDFLFVRPFFGFIDWLNLDFGVETCFYDGLTIYAKTWLQFAFPFYLFSLILVVTIVTNRSTKISKLLPRNIIAVFATVLLITYAKLVRAARLAYPFSSLTSSANITYIVWGYDGSMQYFGRYHAPLAMFSLLLFIGFLLPLAVILFVHSFLRKITVFENRCAEVIFSCIRRKLFYFKPIFDAYEAPYKIRHCYWTGLLLLLRILVLFILSGDDTNLQPTTSAGVTGMSVMLVGMVLLLGIYRSKLVKALECAHYINLALLEFITLILELSGSDPLSRAIVLCVSIGLSFILFVAAIAIQIYKKLQNCFPKLELWNKELQKKWSWLRNQKSIRDGLQVSFIRERHHGPTHSSVSISQDSDYAEP